MLWSNQLNFVLELHLLQVFSIRFTMLGSIMTVLARINKPKFEFEFRMIGNILLLDMINIELLKKTCKSVIT